MRCLILRTNRTLKKKNVSNKKDSFEFEDGKYFVEQDKVILTKGFFGWKPCLIYKEGISVPIGFDTIQQIKNDKGDKVDTILIDAFSVHNLTSRELLSVLTKTSFTKMETLIIVMLALNILIGIIGIGLQYGN